MRKPKGITAAFIIAFGVFATALYIIVGMWLPSARQIDNQRDEATRRSTQHVTGTVVPTGQPDRWVQDSNGRTFHHLVEVEHPNFQGNPQRSPIIVSVESPYPPNTVGLNVSQNGHVVHANELPESHRHWLPWYIGLAVAILGLIILAILGVVMAGVWRDYYDNVDRERRRLALQEEEENRELSKRADLSADQLYLQSFITRVEQLDDADPEKANLLKLAHRLCRAASDAKGLKLELEVYAELMGHSSLKSQD